jgi:hypothetical protein
MASIEVVPFFFGFYNLLRRRANRLCPRYCSGGLGGTRRTCEGPASLPVAAVATTTNTSTVADSSRAHLLEGFNDMLLMEQLETRDEEEGSA